MSIKNHLDREQLYDLIWSAPISQLAPQLGLSDVGLAKICDRLRVPRPEMGYWIKVRHGKKSERPPLPNPAPGSPLVVSFNRRDPRPAGNRALVEVPRVPVPDRLVEPHPLTEATRLALNRSRRSHSGIVWPADPTSLDIRVSTHARGRALLLVDTLIKALEARDHGVCLSSSDARVETRAVIAEELVAFHLGERLRQIPHELTAEERRRERVHGRSYGSEFDHTPSGELRIVLDSGTHMGLRHTWSDGRRRLEDRLGEVVAGMEAVAHELHRRHLEQEEERRRRAEEQRRLEAQRRRLEHQQALGKHLRTMATAWREARFIREFLEAFEAKLPTQEDPRSRSWLAWARQAADQLDPLSNLRRIALPIEPPSEPEA